MITMGDTRVLCAASVEERVPPFRKGSGRGWVTAEYAMLPRSTQTRSERDGRKGRVDGRVQEIQRLIGRSLRAAVDFEALGERSILIDCDVIVADGGTRTASITGGYVALALAIARLRDARVVWGPSTIDHLARFVEWDVLRPLEDPDSPMFAAPPLDPPDTRGPVSGDATKRQ